MLLAAPVLGVFAIFKTYSERTGRPLSLIANDQRNMWGRARQTSGVIITTISLDFQATNMSDGTVQISAVRLFWPWVSRRAILQTILLIESPDPRDNTYSHRNPILAHTLKNVSVHFSIDHAVGRPGKPMHVIIRAQDHARNWYWLTFRNVRSGPLRQPAAPAVQAPAQ